MVNERIELRLARDGFSLETNVYIAMVEPNGKVKSIAKTIEMEKHAPHLMPDPPLKVGDDTLKSLMDQLWQLGIRPTNYKDTRGEVVAMSAHLDDMRMIVKKSMKIGEEK